MFECDVKGHEGEQVVFKSGGWKFKHLRLWQAALVENQMTVGELAELVSERIESWTIKADGEAVPFQPGPAAFDELEPAVAQWLVYRFRQAYEQAGQPDPN